MHEGMATIALRAHDSRRSWSQVGERTLIDSQRLFENRYLFSAVAPLSGKGFHPTGIDGFDSGAAHAFLLELKKQHPDRLVILALAALG